MSKNLFYVVYPKNTELRNLLNAIKLMADITQRTEAHITVRGPYKKRLNSDLIDKYSTIISGENLKISGISNFFAYGQNTVFFKCDDNQALRKIWNKITYNEFKPHITIYDGDNEEFAYKLYREISSHFKPFLFEVDKLETLEPKNRYSLEFYRLSNSFDYSTLSNIFNEDFSKSFIKKLPDNKKIQYTKNLCNYLYNNFSSITT